MNLKRVSLLLFSLLCVACSPDCSAPKPGVQTSAETLPEPPPPAEAIEETKRIVFLGDSLTAGQGLPREHAYPAYVEQKVREENFSWDVVNAGVSGDTTAGGANRLDWIFQRPVSVLFVALGANDGLRGIAPAETKKNLLTIIERAQAEGARVILAGMHLPENYGEDYRKEFDRIFQEVVREKEVVFLPFLLEGVALVPSLNQADGIHPTAEGQARIAEHVWPYVEKVLREHDANTVNE